MICTRCQKDSRKKDRTGDACPHCGQRFVLDPSAAPGLSDVRYQAAIDHVSANGAVRFLPEHVWYEVGRLAAVRAVRRVRSIHIGLFVAVAFVLTIVLCIGLGPVGGFLAAITAGLGWVITYLLARRAGLYTPQGLGLNLPEAQRLWSRWREVHKEIPGLLVQKGGKKRTQAADIDPEELKSYSFDRAVICDDPRMVDLLVANRFHFENNCAILSEGGAPAAVFDTVREMIRNNPNIRVFVLHHCTPSGCGLAARLRADPAWFKGIGAVFDVGLLPDQVHELGGAWEPATDRDLPDGLTPADERWLRRWQLSLFAIRPEQLLRRLYRAIVEAERPEAERSALTQRSGDSSGGDVVILPGFGGDAGPSEGDGDGFG
jgi:hypothetical protein